MTEPAVVGAVIDLGNCLNLLDSRAIDLVGLAYTDLVSLHRDYGVPLPENSLGPDLRSRKLDCAVLRFLHRINEEAGEPPFDTVRAAFVEGERLYPNAGFAERRTSNSVFVTRSASKVISGPSERRENQSPLPDNCR